VSAQSSAPWRDDAARKASGPAPRERRVKPLPWAGVLIILVVALFALGGAMAPGLKPVAKQEAAPSLEELVPTDAAAFVSIHFGAQAMKDAKNPKKDDPAAKQNLTRRLALELAKTRQLDVDLAKANLKGAKGPLVEDDIERITLVWLPPDNQVTIFPPRTIELGPEKVKGKGPQTLEPPPPVRGNDYCLIIQTRQQSALEVAKRLLANPRQNEFFHRRYWVNDTSADRAFYVAGEHVFVFGTRGAIQHFIRKLPTTAPHPLAEALRETANPQEDAIRIVVAHNYTQHIPSTVTQLDARDLPLISMRLVVESPAKKEVFMEHRQIFASQERAQQGLIVQALGVPSDVVGKTVRVYFHGQGAAANSVGRAWREEALTIKACNPSLNLRLIAPR
jgi:hypothetical protein